MSKVCEKSPNPASVQEGAEWARYKQVKAFCPIGRGRLDKAAEAGEIRVCNLVDDGKEKGTRLYHVGSIRAYIEKMEAETRRKLEAKKLERQGVAA